MPQFNSDTLNVVVHQASGKGGESIDYWIVGLIALIVIIALAFIFYYRKRLRTLGKKFKPSEYAIEIAGFSIKGNVEYYSADQEIAWKIYVELVTRVTANELKEDDGILREAFDSMYKLFGVLRETLKNAPLELARPVPAEKLTVASVLLKVMNEHLRPFLAKWHPLLQLHEQNKAETISQSAHEKSWSLNPQCRADLKALSAGLNQYIIALKDIAEGKTNNK